MTKRNNYRETTAKCSGCGSTHAERKETVPEGPHGLSSCPHCGSDKCVMCDMGDDVECGCCPA